MAGQILTFENLRGVATLSAIYGYQRGFSEAITSETSEAQGEALSDTISALHVDALLPKGLGPFHDDPTWDSFVQKCRRLQSVYQFDGRIASRSRVLFRKRIKANTAKGTK